MLSGNEGGNIIKVSEKAAGVNVDHRQKIHRRLLHSSSGWSWVYLDISTSQ